MAHLLASPLLSIPTLLHGRAGNACATRVARGHGGDDRGSFILALVVVHQHFNGDMFACKNALHARLNVGGLVARWNAHGHLRAVVWHVLYRVVFRIIYFFVRYKVGATFGRFKQRQVHARHAQRQRGAGQRSNRQNFKQHIERAISCCAFSAVDWLAQADALYQCQDFFRAPSATSHTRDGFYFRGRQEWLQIIWAGAISPPPQESADATP